jgi:hypothetical protein
VHLPAFRQVTLLARVISHSGRSMTISPHVRDVSCDESRSLPNIHHGSVSIERALLRSYMGIFS